MNFNIYITYISDNVQIVLTYISRQQCNVRTKHIPVFLYGKSFCSTGDAALFTLHVYQGNIKPFTVRPNSFLKFWSFWNSKKILFGYYELLAEVLIAICNESDFLSQVVQEYERAVIFRLGRLRKGIGKQETLNISQEMWEV